MATNSRTAIRKQMSSLHALAESGDPKAREEFEKLARDNEANTDLRSEAIYLLGRHFSDSLSILLSLLETDDEVPEVRAAVVGTIGDNKLTEATEAIRKIAKDRAEPSRARSRAISVLAQLNSDSGKPLILETIADNTESAQLRRSLFFDVHPEVDLNARELLLRLVNDRNEEGEIRAAAIDRLATVPTIDADLFLSIIRDPDEHFNVRYSALSQLSRRDDDTERKQ